MNERLKKKIEQGIIAQEGGSYCVWGDDYSYLTLIDKDGYKIDDYLIDIDEDEGCVWYTPVSYPSVTLVATEL